MTAALLKPTCTEAANPWLTPRTYTVEFDRWGFGSIRPLNWCLRMYGHGGGTVGTGVPNRFEDEATAHRVGKHWVETGRDLELAQ